MGVRKDFFTLAVKDPKEITSQHYEDKKVIPNGGHRGAYSKGYDIDTKAVANRLVEELYKEQLAYNEFLLDARKYPNLSEWERSFTNDLWQGFQRGICIRFEDLSPRQLIAARRIQKKLYSL